jgi:truncated hemoglobin YjbI
MTDSDDATPSLFEWAGGEPAIRQLMDCFYDRVEGDELLSPYFPGGVGEEHRAHVTTWWSEVFGGPTATARSWAATRACSPTTVGSRSRPRSGFASSRC